MLTHALLALALFAPHGLTHRSVSHQPTAQLIERWESSDRAAWQRPEQLVAALGVKTGQSIADIGAGSGYFTLRFAEAVGRGGRVFAVDIDRELLAYLDRRARLRQLAQVTTVRGGADAPGLAPASIDLAFICDTLHHIDQPAAYLERVRDSLRAGGRLAIVEFRKVHEPFGPPFEHRMDRARIVSLAAEAGMRLVAEHTFLPRQTLLIFSPR